jgi:HSP20 family protein
MSSEQERHDDLVEATAEAERLMRPQRVPVNMYETTESLVVVAPLPAVQPEDVHIELRPGALRFWAHLRSAAPRRHLIREWDYGGYERELELPVGWGGEVDATLANGQLVVRVKRGAATGTTKVSPAQH